MSLIRPELTARLWHWREALAAAAIALLGVWTVGRAEGWLMQAVGALILAGALAALYAAVQRARFRSGGQGPGIVRVTERRIAYLGPRQGGAVSLNAIAEIALAPDPDGHHWELSHPEGPPLFIPVDAVGADALFDAFAALPGLDPARLAGVAERPANGRVIVWSRSVLPKA